MLKSILMGASALAILAAIPAFAANEVKTETGTTVKVEGPNTHNKADDAANTGKISSEKVEKAADDVSAAVDEAYRDMRDFFKGETAPKDLKNMQITKSQTAAGMIGQPIKDMNDKTVGKVHDIIVDKNGGAKMVIVSDGGVLGMGDKLAAFDYDVIVSRNKDGDVISTLTEKTIDRAVEFSYDAKDAGENVRVLPVGGYSVAKILDGKLPDPQSKSVGEVENIAFRNGEADLVVVAFNQILGLGGEKAVLNYDELSLVQKDKGVDFRLTAAQAAQFEKFKQKASN
jgi:hypothetical protein